MNPNSPTPREELEAQVTALLLGELTPRQAAALRKLIEHDRPLAELHDRLKHAIDLVRETETTPAPELGDPPAPLKLTDNRREQLLQHFKTVRPVEFAPKRQWYRTWLVPAAAVAVLVGALAVVTVPSMRRLDAYDLAGLVPEVSRKRVSVPSLGLPESAEKGSEKYKDASGNARPAAQPADLAFSYDGGTDAGELSKRSSGRSSVAPPNAGVWTVVSGSAGGGGLSRGYARWTPTPKDVAPMQAGVDYAGEPAVQANPIAGSPRTDIVLPSAEGLAKGGETKGEKVMSWDASSATTTENFFAQAVAPQVNRGEQAVALGTTLSAGALEINGLPPSGPGGGSGGGLLTVPRVNVASDVGRRGGDVRGGAAPQGAGGRLSDATAPVPPAAQAASSGASSSPEALAFHRRYGLAPATPAPTERVPAIAESLISAQEGADGKAVAGTTVTRGAATLPADGQMGRWYRTEGTGLQNNAATSRDSFGVLSADSQTRAPASTEFGLDFDTDSLKFGMAGKKDSRQTVWSMADGRDYLRNGGDVALFGGNQVQPEVRQKVDAEAKPIMGDTPNVGFLFSEAGAVPAATPATTEHFTAGKPARPTLGATIVLPQADGDKEVAGREIAALGRGVSKGIEVAAGDTLTPAPQPVQPQFAPGQATLGEQRRVGVSRYGAYEGEASSPEDRAKYQAGYAVASMSKGASKVTYYTDSTLQEAPAAAQERGRPSSEKPAPSQLGVAELPKAPSVAAGQEVKAAGKTAGQANEPYSLNVVGYYNVQVPVSALTLITNQLGVGAAGLPATGVAPNDAAQRQAEQILLRQKLAEAHGAEGRNETAKAAELYDQADSLAKKIGPSNVPAETHEIRAGQAKADGNLTLAHQEKKRELEELQRFQEVLRTKMTQENAELALPKTSMVEVVDKAVPPTSDPGLGERFRRTLAGGATSTARVKLDRDISDIPGLQADQTHTFYDPYFIQTENEVIQSDAVLGKVVENLNLTEAWGKNKGQRLKKNEAVAMLRDNLKLQAVPNTNLLDIKVTTGKPDEAAKLANAIAEAYRGHRLEQRKELAKAGVQALESRWGDVEARVRETQKQLDELSAQQAQGQQVKEAEPEPVKKSAVPIPVPQPEVQTGDNAFSTFSLNVSDVSFKLAAASLERGVLPEPGSIRSEEFINAFDYRDPEPAGGAPIAFAWERGRYPFAQSRDLLRFSLKTAAQGRQAGRPLNLVLLLDNSGSMERADRVQIIYEALRVLAGQLQPQDRLSIIAFARTARLLADGIAGNQSAAVVEEAANLTPQGGTNLEEAMNLAYQTALRHYQANGINRVVLLTDGAANLGDVDPGALKQKVESHRKQGIALDGFGIGWEGYNDDLLEVLTRNGDGRYGFINTPEEAATEFAGQLAGALRVAASDVKVQVEFNPARVTAYRQVGYARHQLTKEQFRDNTVDAAEIGAAESGNALYVVEVNPQGQGPLATVRVRHKIPGTSDYREQEWVVPYTGAALPLAQCGPALRLAATASAFSEWLATSPYAAEVRPDALLAYLRGVPEQYGADARPKKLEWMLRQAQSLAGK